MPYSRQQVDEACELIRKYGGVRAAARASDIPRSTLSARASIVKFLAPKEPPAHRASPKARPIPPKPRHPRPVPKRHLIIPDTQVKPGVPLDHLDWIGQAIVDYMPDVVVHIGDHFDFPSLSSYEEPGSIALEGARIQADIDSGNEAFARLCAPMEKEQRRNKKWRPRKIFTMGNHEQRADRIALNNARWQGVIGSDACDLRDFERHPYLERVEVDGVLYSHFFQQTHSDRAIGGSALNKLTKVGQSFVQGHVQGFDYGTKMLASGNTIHGVVAGSAYLHTEAYRGAQGQRHARLIVVLNEVRDGDFDIMPVSLAYLCRKHTGMDLYEYMVRKYAHQNWEHLL